MHEEELEGIRNDGRDAGGTRESSSAVPVGGLAVALLGHGARRCRDGLRRGA